MTEIIPLLVCLEPHLNSTTLRQLRHVLYAMLCIPNRVTMLGLSRWTEKGGSYRTLQRLYQMPLNWLLIHWTLVQTHLVRADGIYVLAGDEVVVNKAGQKTHGVGRFYSSLAQRVIPSVSLLTLSLIDVERRQAYPLHIQQIMPTASAETAPGTPAKRKPGRPKGRKNYARPVPVLSPLFQLLQRMLTCIAEPLAQLGVNHIVLDGKFGNYPATWTVRQAGYHIVSKMRQDAALYLPYSGAKPRRGPTPRYGDKLDYSQLPAEPPVASYIDEDYRVDIYHRQAYHKDYPDLLNVVVIFKTHRTTGKRGHGVLFSTDLDLSAAQIVDFYRLRFQIEFNFRDAKQYWGLQDFMNVSPQAVTNAVNLAFMMVTLSPVMLKPYREHDPHFSVLDLKARFRARRYLIETINLLPQMPEPDLISRLWHRLSRLGSIRPPHFDAFVP